MKKIFKIIYYLFLGGFILIVAFLILSNFPVKSGYKMFIVLSGSMEPKIHTGSVVVVKEQKEYKVGDVITFGENTKKKKPTTHRIVEVKEDEINGEISYITKGDVNNASDQSSIKKDEVLGKVIFSVPYFGYVVSTAQNPIGFMMIIIIPAVIIIYDEVLNIKKEILKKIDYKKRMKKRLASSNGNKVASAEQDLTEERVEEKEILMK